MKHKLQDIEAKPEDYKICKDGHLNWYESKECNNCNTKEFYRDEKEIKAWIIDERAYLSDDGIKDEESQDNWEYEV